MVIFLLSNKSTQKNHYSKLFLKEGRKGERKGGREGGGEGGREGGRERNTEREKSRKLITNQSSSFSSNIVPTTIYRKSSQLL